MTMRKIIGTPFCLGVISSCLAVIVGTASGTIGAAILNQPDYSAKEAAKFGAIGSSIIIISLNLIIATLFLLKIYTLPTNPPEASEESQCSAACKEFSLLLGVLSIGALFSSASGTLGARIDSDEPESDKNLSQAAASSGLGSVVIIFGAYFFIKCYQVIANYLGLDNSSEEHASEEQETSINGIKTSIV